MKFLKRAHFGVTIVALTAALLLGAACGRSPQAKSERYIASGKKFLEEKDASRAILQFRNAVQATPKNAEAYYQLGLAYLTSGDVRRGAASLQKAIDLNPKHASAQLRLADLFRGVGDQDLARDAQKRLLELVSERPDDADALHSLGLTEMKLGESDVAMTHLEEAIRAAPQDLVFAYSLAQAKLQNNDIKGAEATLKEAAGRLPDSPAAMIVLGRFYAYEKRYPEAMQQFQNAVRLKPDHAPSLYNLASLENLLGQKDKAAEHFRALSTTSDETVNTLYGLFLLQEGKRDEAVKEFERLSKANPEKREIRTRLVATYRLTNRSADADRVLNEALKKNPNDLDALLQRGELMLDRGQAAQAKQDFNAVLHLRPDSAEAHYAVASMYAKSGATLLQKQELSEALRLNPSLLPARLEMARLQINDRSANAALELLDATPGDQRNSPDVLDQRNWALLSSGRRPEARKGVEQALSRRRSVDALLQDAALKIDDRQYVEARQPLQEALQKNPEDLRALQALVQTYGARKEVAQAVEAVRKHSAQYPKSATISYFLGNVLMQTGDLAGARAALSAAKTASPDFTPADVTLAQISLQQRNWTEARAQLNQLLGKGEDAVAHLWLGMLEASVNNPKAAITEFRSVIELQPNNATALNNLAYLLSEQGDHSDTTLQYAQKAREIEPENPQNADTLGWVLYRRGVYDLAVQHLQAAVSKSPTAMYQYHLGMACYKAGQEDRGRAALSSALRLNPNLPDAPEALKLINAQR